MSSAPPITDELSATANEAVLRPFFTAGFLLGFGTLLCLLSHRITALIARRALASSVHLATLILLAVSLILYSASKLLVYLVLLERLHIVHGNSATGRGGRTRSPLYMIGAALLVVWTGLIFLIVPWKEAQLRRSDGTCVLSLRLWTLFPSIAMDCLANLYLSAAFIVPVARGRFSDAKRLARTSTVATLASLCVTLGNALALIILHGKERMFVCLGVCTLDVTANAVIVYLVTMPRREATTSLAAVGPAPRATNAAGGESRPLRDCKCGGGGGAKQQQQQRRWSWRRPPSSSGIRRRTDLSSISVRIDEEVAVDCHNSPEIESSCRMPRPPERIKTTGSTRSFVREAAPSSSGSSGSRRLSGSAVSSEGAESHSLDRGPEAEDPRCSSIC
ncbi:hypothetical protein JCM8115_004659 [Rhodotorula mucilaginosa]